MKAEDSLWPVIEARDASMAGLVKIREVLLMEVHVRDQALLNKEQVIEDLKAELREKESIVKLNATLEEKEAVIREQRQALSAYRATYSVLGVFIRPLGNVIYLTPAFTIPSDELKTLNDAVVKTVRDFK